MLGLRSLRWSLVSGLAMIARLRLGMLHGDGLLVLHLLVLSLLMGLSLCHGSLVLWILRLSPHLLLLLKQMWWKSNKRALAYLSVPHGL